MEKHDLQNRTHAHAQDLACAVLFALLFGFLFLTRAYGIGFVDDVTLIPNALRIIRADRLFVDIWDVSQLSSLFEAIPCMLWMKLTGSTDGFVLAYRRLYVLTELPVAVFLYRKLREYRCSGLIAAALFCIYGPFYTINYCTAALNCLMILCVSLFTAKKPLSAPRLVGLGVLFFFAVLAEPTLCAAYIAYSAAVLIASAHTKRTASVPAETSLRSIAVSRRTWGWVTIGMALFAAAFLLFLQRTSGIGQIVRAIPELFTGSDYRFTQGAQRNQFSALLTRIADVPRVYHPLAIGALILTAAAAVLCRKRESRVRTSLFFIACAALSAVLILTVVPLGVNYSPDEEKIMIYYSVPFVIFALICYAVKDRRGEDARVFAFWIVGVAASLCVDFASRALFCFGGVIAQTTAVIFFFQIMRDCLRSPCGELCASQGSSKNRRRGNAQNRFSRARRAAACLCAVLVGVSAIAYAGHHLTIAALSPACERHSAGYDMPIDRRLERGPLKGIRTNRYIEGVYGDILADMDVIAAVADGPLYVAGDLYLPYFLDVPCGTFSPEITESFTTARLLHYWDLHPERIPACVYIPRYDLQFAPQDPETLAQSRAFFEERFVCTAQEGKAGTILRVVGRDASSAAAGNRTPAS